MKSFIKTLSIGLFTAIICLFVYDQYFNIPNDIYTNELDNTVLIPTNYEVNTNSI